MIRAKGICSHCRKWKKVLIVDRINPLKKVCEDCLSKQYFTKEEER